MKSQKAYLILVQIFLIVALLAGCKAASPASSTAAKPTSTASATTAKPATSAATTAAASTTLKPLPGVINMLQRPGSSTGPIAIGLAGALTSKLGTKISVQDVTADLAELTTMRTKQGDLSVMGSTSIFNALNGLGDIAQWGPQPIRLVFRGAPQFIVLYTTKKTGIKTYADLKGKRLAYVPSSSTMNDTTAAFLEAMGLSWDDVKKVNVDGSGVSIDMLKAGVLDVPVVASYPSPAMVELDGTLGLVILPFNPTQDAEKAFLQKKPAFQMQNVPKGSIMGLEQDMRAPTSTLNLYCYDFLDEDVVYQVTRATYAVVDDTKTAYDAGWRKAGAATVPFIAPFHPGAVRFYKEAGVWTAENEKFQQELLKAEQDRLAAWKSKTTTTTTK